MIEENSGGFSMVLWFVFTIPSLYLLRLLKCAAAGAISTCRTSFTATHG